MKQMRCMDKNYSCLNCGACCAYYRVSFYWAEGDDASEGGVPVALTEKLDALRRVMRGTNQSGPRCHALEGKIGKEVFCSIYAKRPTVCRDIPVSWSNGVQEEKCAKARAAWGLGLLGPDYD